MYWLAVMPLRGGSKSIPYKNILSLAGRPLFAWSLEQAILSRVFDKIVVASDDAAIRAMVSVEFGTAVVVVDRSASGATDTASSESVLREMISDHPCDIVALIQATSPLTRAEDFSAARHQFETDSLDALVTGVLTRRFYWSVDGTPLNYDPAARPRRQEFGGSVMENGAFYYTRTPMLASHGSRLGGRIGVHIMADETAIELDEPADITALEQLLIARRVRTCGRLRAVIFDVDGTLTDGGMYYGDSGLAFKRFDTRDGLGIVRLREHGFRVAVITGEDDAVTRSRMRKLGIIDYHAGVADKLPLLERLAEAWEIPLNEIAMIGDDLGDLECLRAVGFSACPLDAVPAVQGIADYVCVRPGGGGAVREFCDYVLARTTDCS